MQLNISIYNTSGATSFTPITSGTREISISENGGIDTIHPIAIGNTISITVTDNVAIKIRLLLDGEEVYSNQIKNVYTLDTDFSIINVLSYDISNPLYKLVYPKYNTFKDPCSFSVDVYDATNSLGSIRYYLNNEHVVSQRNYSYIGKSPEEIQIKIGIITYNPITCSIAWSRFGSLNLVTGNIEYSVVPNTIDEYLEQDTTISHTLEEFRPTITLNVSNTTLKDDVYALNSTSNILLDVTVPSGNYSKKIIISSPNGAILYDSGYTTLDTDVEYVLKMLKLGSYTVDSYALDIDCNIEYLETTYLTVFNSFQISTGSECTKYLLKNLSKEDSVTITINRYNDDTKSFEPYGTYLDYEILPNTELEVSFDEINIYSVDLIQESISYTYPLFTGCYLDNCLSNSVIDILCPKTSCEDECSKLVEYTRIVALKDTLKGKLRNMFTFSSRYYTIEFMNKLDEVASLSSIITALNNYCKTCGDTDTAFEIKSPSPCGCGGDCGNC